MQEQPFTLNPSSSTPHSHYLHTTTHPHSQRTLLKQFHIYEHGSHHTQIAIVNHNLIEVYRIIGCSVVYYATYQFMCDITVLEVVVAKGDGNDVFFVGDQMGRYFFWAVGLGFLVGSGAIKAVEFLAPAYQKMPAEEKQPQFSGISCTHQSMDTYAVIFFTVSTKIILLKIRLSKNKIYFTQPPSQFALPYPDICHIGILNSKDPYIGIVQQKQQKTFLRIHKTAGDHFQCHLSIQKPNLCRFYAYSTQPQQLITLTNTQLSIFNLKTQQNFCTFQIPESGYVANIEHDLYVYVGEIGTQMIVFNKKCYRSYGAFMLENQVCMRLAGFGRMADQGYLVAVIDQGYTVEFVALYEDSWKPVRSIFSTASIFSIEDLDRQDETLAVVRAGQNIYQVGILSKHLTTKLQKQTQTPSPILSLFSTQSSNSLILSTSSSNFVYLYSQQHQSFQLGFQFDSGTIINVIDKYIIMEYKIYEMDISVGNKSKCAIRELWNQRTCIVGGDCFGGILGWMCGDFCWKFYNTGTKEIDRIRKNCVDQYIWKFCAHQVLLVGCLDLPGKLKIVPVFKQSTTVPLHCSQLITSIGTTPTTITISFNTCQLQVYSYPQFQLIHNLCCASSPLQLINFNNNILGYSVSEAFVISFDGGVSCRQLEFDASKENCQVVFLGGREGKEAKGKGKDGKDGKEGKFVVGHGKSLGLYKLDQDKPEHNSSFRVLSVSMEENPPFVTVNKNTLYIFQKYEAITRDINTAQLLKKQSHGLKQICCIQKLELGLIVCGVNDMDSVQIFVFDYTDLQILCAESLHKTEIYDKKLPTAIRQHSPNSFLLRQGPNLSLYSITPQQTLKQIFTSKTNLQGYTLAIHPQLSMAMISDPLRYLVVYDYRLGKLVNLCRYQGLNTINDVEFLGNSVVVGNGVGVVNVVEFDLSKDDVNRTMMTQVANYRTGSEVIYVRKGKKGVIYSTISGRVGRLTTISPSQFPILKQAQKTILSLLHQQNQLKYEDWTLRTVSSDKMIDGYLIQQFLKAKIPEESKRAVREVWDAVIGDCFM